MLASTLSNAVCKISEEGEGLQNGAECIFFFLILVCIPAFKAVLRRKLCWQHDVEYLKNAFQIEI